MSNISGSRLYQRKATINVKHVSVHIDLVEASSVCELVKPLNVSKLANLSKPVLANNATKPNACNASSVSQRIKPLNLSQHVFSSNTTKRNVCNTSSVSQLVKILNVSKTVCNYCN